MNRAFWTRTITQDKQVIHYEEGYLADDNFQALVQGDALGRVTTTYTKGLPYGEEKISVSVSVACDQNEATINKAGELTFLKGVELVSDGWSVLQQLDQQQKGS